MEFCWFLRSVTFVVRFLGQLLGRDVCLWLQQIQDTGVFFFNGTSDNFVDSSKVPTLMNES